ELVSFTGSSQRRSVDHEFLKRDGSQVEDLGRRSRRIEVKLRFIGKDCAQRFSDFEAKVHRNPTGLLVHPTTGRWIAFCEGPQHSVDFSRAINEIEVAVSWKESDLDATIEADVPDVATAAQNCSGQVEQMQKSVAGNMCETAKASTTLGSVSEAADTA